MNKIQLCLMRSWREWVGVGANPANDGHWEYREESIPLSEPIDVENMNLRHLIESACRALQEQSDNLGHSFLGWKQV
jgi:hypothetical protein